MGERSDKTPRQWCVTVDWYGDEVEHICSSRTRSGARYDLFLEISDPFPDLTFGEFLPMVKSVRVSGRRTPYDYLWERYGCVVAVGDRVIAAGRPGVVAEPDNSNPRDNYCRVIFDGENRPMPCHPIEIKVAANG